MEIGEFVDFCLEWNEINIPDEDTKQRKKQEVKKRKATQSDWDAFFG